MRKLLLTLFSLLAVCPLLSSQTFYLRGINNNWNTDDKYKFTGNNGVYTLRVDELTSAYSFKIATSGWDIQFGSTAAFAYDTPMVCVAGDGNNFQVPKKDNSTTKIAGATLTFDYRNTSAPTLTVTPDLYLAGNMTGWNNQTAAYRFTESNGVYTLNVPELSGNFRIAAGVTPDWPANLNFGGSKNMELGQTYDCTTGSGNDMSMSAGNVNNAVITFDKGARTVTVSSVSADLGDRDLYLAGSINGWASDNEAYKFTRSGDEYTLTLPGLNGEFKIVTSDWSYQFGCSSAIEYGNIYSCVLAGSGYNMKLSEISGENVTLRFNISSLTVEVSAMPGLYLVGEFNNWSCLPIYRFKYSDGKYVLTTGEFTGAFKIVSSGDYISLGATDNNPFDLNHNYLLSEKGNNISLNSQPSRAAARLKLTLMADGTPDAVTSLTDISAGDDAPAEYFNLQGIRVMHPSNGIYIMRRGREVTKVRIN